MKRSIGRELGFVPAALLVDVDRELSPMGYAIRVRGGVVARGEVALAPGWMDEAENPAREAVIAHLREVTRAHLGRLFHLRGAQVWMQSPELKGLELDLQTVWTVLRYLLDEQVPIDDHLGIADLLACGETDPEQIRLALAPAIVHRVGENARTLPEHLEAALEGPMTEDQLEELRSFAKAAGALVTEPRHRRWLWELCGCPVLSIVEVEQAVFIATRKA